MDQLPVATPVVQRLDQEDLARAVTLLVRAFDHDPLNRVLIPDPEHRQRLLEVIFRSRPHAALADGEVFVALEGVTCRP